MEKPRRNSVYVALHGTLGRDLIFRHYTNKVVVAQCLQPGRPKLSRSQKSPKRNMTEANYYAQMILCNPELKALYEKYLREGETVYRKAIKAYFEEQMSRRA
ncbi:MAG TPA: hypothetical protein VI385_01010 [Flavisolibacter sp.]